MRRMRSSPWTIALLSLVFMLVAGVLWAQPVQAAGWLDRIFNRNAEEATTELNTAGEKTLTGTGSQGPMVSNTNGYIITDAYQRIVGVAKAEAGSEQGSMLEQKYGRGALGELAHAISYMYEPPAGTAVFVADLMNEAHIVPRAQAQGLGFAALDPVLSTWKMFRNLAYLLYVILFLVIGFMIMFKSQMGKAGTTLQTALPNIVISLIFVTFSYAIAGFLIDLMYVLMYLLVGMFPEAGGSKILDYNFLQLGWTIVMGDGANTGAFKSFAAAVDGFVTQSLNFSGIDDNNSFFGAISGVTLSLILAVAILVGVFKLFFELLKTYVTIVLMIAFSPLLLMLGAIPGQDVFQGWIRDLVGNLMAFPTTLLIIIVFRMFSNTNAGLTDAGGEAGGFLPPFLIGRGTSGVLSTLVGIGIVLIMPELIVQMKKAIGVKDGIFQTLAKDMYKNYVGNVKEGVRYGAPAIGAGVGAVSGGIGEAMQKKTGWSRLTALGRGAVAGAGAGARKGTEFTKGFENLIEGKTFDPNNWETVLQRLGQQKADEEQNKKKQHSPKVNVA